MHPHFGRSSTFERQQPSQTSGESRMRFESVTYGMHSSLQTHIGVRRLPEISHGKKSVPDMRQQQLPRHPGGYYAVRMTSGSTGESEIGERCASGGTVRNIQILHVVSTAAGRELEE